MGVGGEESCDKRREDGRWKAGEEVWCQGEVTHHLPAQW